MSNSHYIWNFTYIFSFVRKINITDKFTSVCKINVTYKILQMDLHLTYNIRTSSVCNVNLIVVIITIGFIIIIIIITVIITNIIINIIIGIIITSKLMVYIRTLR